MFILRNSSWVLIMFIFRNSSLVLIMFTLRNSSWVPIMFILRNSSWVPIMFIFRNSSWVLIMFIFRNSSWVLILLLRLITFCIHAELIIFTLSGARIALMLTYLHTSTAAIRSKTVRLLTCRYVLLCFSMSVKVH